MQCKWMESNAMDGIKCLDIYRGLVVSKACSLIVVAAHNLCATKIRRLEYCNAQLEWKWSLSALCGFCSCIEGAVDIQQSMYDYPYCIRLNSISLSSIPLHSIIPFHSVPLNSIHFHSIPLHSSSEDAISFNSS